jgi:hypothetical protein
MSPAKPARLLATTALLLCTLPAAATGIASPDKAWTLALPPSGWIKLQAKQRPDGRQNYFLFSGNDHLINLSVFMEPAVKCQTAPACADMIAANPGPGYANATDVERLERNGFAIVKSVVTTTTGDKSIRQFNYSAEIIHKGYWLDMHISRVSAADDGTDNTALSAIIDGVSFVDGVDGKDVITPAVSLGVGAFKLEDGHAFNFTGPTTWLTSAQHKPGANSVTVFMKPDYGYTFQSHFQIQKNPSTLKPDDLTEILSILLKQFKDQAKADSPTPITALPEKNGLQLQYFLTEDKAWKADAGTPRYTLVGVAGNADALILFSFSFNDAGTPEKQLFLDMMDSATYQ